MKYLYGDSTEFPLQTDFLGLLDNFIDTSVKSITLENTVFSLKEDIKDRRRLKNSVLDEMDSFLTTVENAIAGCLRFWVYFNTNRDEKQVISKTALISKAYHVFFQPRIIHKILNKILSFTPKSSF